MEKMNPDQLIKVLQQRIQKDLEKPVNIQCEPEVEIIADSINSEGNRITTFKLKFWRAILPELSRHRVFSFCVQSSRATPTDKLLEQVKEAPWGPKHYGWNQKGMTSAENKFTDKQLNIIKYAWLQSANSAANVAASLAKANLAKEVVNRLLEPYISCNVLLTGSEFDNFFNLRIAPDAQPEMYDLAKKMKEALDKHKPVLLLKNHWHLPFITKEDIDSISDIRDLPLISAARCARVSRVPFDEIKPDLEKDLARASFLVKHRHMSPFEHVCYPVTKDEYILSNVKGFNQLRSNIEASINESKRNSEPDKERTSAQ